jgi:hypothetical protein
MISCAGIESVVANSQCFFPFEEVNMSTHHAHTHRTIHLAEHRGLAVLMVLAALAIGVIAVAAILSTPRPVTTVVAPNNAAEQARLEFRRGEWSINYPAPAAAALDQHERQANFAGRAAAAESARLSFRRGEWNPAQDIAAAAEQARLEFRRGEWYAGYPARAVPAAALDLHERQANYASRVAAAEYARLLFRRGEWNAAKEIADAAEQARLEFRRGEWSGK